MHLDTRLCTESQPVSLTWIADIGSDVDAIGIPHLDKLGVFVENLDLDSDDVRTADGTSLTPVGTISATLASDTLQHQSVIHVYDGLTDALLSIQSLKALGYLPDSWPKQVFSATRVSPMPVNPMAAELERVRTDLLAEFANVSDGPHVAPYDRPCHEHRSGP